MDGYYFLMDVGGTTIKVNCLNENSEPLFVTNQEFPAKSQADRETILNNFHEIITKTNQEIIGEGYQLLGVGIAFPGPFDYINGISLMENMRKYDAIYGINLKKLVSQWLLEDFKLEIPIVFENDATAFGLGEYYQRNTLGRGIYITLGTGCGSAVIAEGKIVRSGYGLNDQGMVYDTPFKEGTIDDYLSANGLQNLIRAEFKQELSGYQLFLEAEAGNPRALKVFEGFGKWMGEALIPFIEKIKPDELVFGGEISGSLPYFLPSLQAELKEPLTVKKTQNTSLATLKGLVSLIKN